MRYRYDQLQKLQERWRLPLIAAGSGLPVEVDGCRSFQDLLQHRLGSIKAQVAVDPDGGCLGIQDADRSDLRNGWEERGEPLLNALLKELKGYGLDEVVAIEAPRYEIREPCDLRGADLRQALMCGSFLENAHFEGADLTNALFDGSRCFETCFDDACCEHASFRAAECHFASFQGALCDHAVFNQADCTMARFDQARLRFASFDATVCFAAVFDGAFLAKSSLSTMTINHLTRFGRPGEQDEAERTRPSRASKKEEGDDWYIVELFPAWLRAAEVNSQIRFLLKSQGYFLEADEYQYLEMVCRRHVTQQHPLYAFFEWFFKDLMFGYGLKWKRPFISVMTIILLWGLGFGLYFRVNTQHGLPACIGHGLYYSIISFTTLGFGSAPDLSGIWPKVLLCSEALLGTILMPLFLLAYARKILQD